MAPTTARAQDATWLANPGSGDFNTTTNWSTGAVPSGVASFGASNTTGIGISGNATPGGLTFNAGAPAYTFTWGTGVSVTLGGAGIVNNSSNAQTFNIGAQTLTFSNSATAGPASIFLNATGGSINFNNSSNAGSANITASGAGTQLNFNDSSSAGSATVINTNGSLLSLDDNSTAGNATITNSGGATMCFCNNATAGNANITNTGSGTVLQFENNTAAGAATITNSNGATVKFLVDGTTSTASYTSNGGILDVSTLTTVGIGSIAGNGTVDLGSAALTVGSNNLSSTYSGVISGTGGSLIKTGSGTLTLSGINTYTGGTTVNGGTLSVTGSLASGVTVNGGGTLGGSGTIGGNVVNSGVVAPGGFNTLTMNGNYTQNSGGSYQVAVNSSGQTSLLSITGTAALGGTVNVQASSGFYGHGVSYTILSATGGVSGAYSGVTSNFAFLTPSLGYDANDVFLTLKQSSNAFSSGAQTANQRAVGAALDQAGPSASGDFANVLGVLIGLDSVQGPRALDVIGGQTYSGFATVAVQSAQVFMTNFAQQVGGGRSGGQTAEASGRIALAEACDAGVGACDTTSPPRWSAWGGGVGGVGTVAGDANSHGVNYSLGGFMAGLDYCFDPQFVAGVTAGYTNSTLYTQGIDGLGTSNTVQLGFYGEFTQGAAYLDALAAYARGQNQMQRPIVIPGLAPRTASSSFLSDQFFGQLEGGYRIGLGGAADAFVTPFARLQGSTVTQAAFSETGADSLDLNVAGQTTNSLRSVLGAQLGGSIDAGWRGKLALVFRLGWSHEYADTSRPVTAGFAGAPAFAFTTQGAQAPREGAVLGLSATTAVADATSLYLRYDGDLEGGNTSHVFSAGVRVIW